MKTRILAVAGLAAFAAACSDSISPGSDRTVSLSFSTRPETGALLNQSGMLDDTITSGSDVLIITSAQVVLREIELKRQNDDLCEQGAGDDDGCEEFETGPMLVDLPLNAGAVTDITIAADTGTYDEIDFEVHKPEDGGDDADAAFLADHPEFDGVSIRVEGTYNGVAFVYTTDLDVEQENELVPPLVITDTNGTNVTLRVDISTWFRNAGGALVNPDTGNKGGANESIVKENIKTSFHAFEDEDRDGDESDESGG